MKCPLCSRKMEEEDSQEQGRFDATYICRNSDCKMGYMAIIYEPGGTLESLNKNCKWKSD